MREIQRDRSVNRERGRMGGRTPQAQIVNAIKSIIAACVGCSDGGGGDGKDAKTKHGAERVRWA